MANGKETIQVYHGNVILSGYVAQESFFLRQQAWNLDMQVEAKLTGKSSHFQLRSW